MKQSLFVERYQDDWQRFEAWLAWREAQGGRHNVGAPPIAASEVPAVYRRICQHLALARQRQYSAEVIDRLHALALRGHHALYVARHRGLPGWRVFLTTDFPRLVRQEWRLVAAAALLFYVPLFALLVALQYFPDFVHYVLDGERIAHIREMYDPVNRRIGMREADTNVQMFAVYIGNNVRIGFQIFATGLAFGIGTVFYLVANGVIIGTIAGYLTATGFGTPFWSFVAGHSALELTALVIAGAAGFKLGLAVIAPGPRSRTAALRAVAPTAVRLVYGAALMLFAAAAVEAFWSPHTLFPPALKYAVGIGMWVLVIAYFVFAGRPRGKVRDAV